MTACLAGMDEYLFRLLRRVSLVDPVHWNFETPQRLDKRPDGGFEVTRAAINVQRHSDDEPIGTPLLDQSGDSLEVRAVFTIGDNTERARRTRYILTDGDADTAKPEVERNYGLGR